MTATLADGSTRVIARSAETPAGRRELIWPSSDARDRKYWHNLWVLGAPEFITGNEAYFDIYRTRWDRAHADGERIVRFAAVWEATDIPSVDLADRANATPATHRFVSYRWPPEAAR
jgi:hypothetical protein